uniref:non-specific serine/threonine protein kinase n=1 Tax=Candidatus Kentrum sp. LFY TaxID=2126342 RepID=A0A450U678_9GAMM|nr:MAG: Leucine rich repeat-containing protein [Candidatus Kentron sp. LFY]
MAYNKAYREAEEKIEVTRRSGTMELDLSQKWNANNKERLGELPQSLARLTELRELNLSGNRLTVLPEFLAQFTQLRVLRLGGNPLAVLPSWLGGLTRLRSLSLRGIGVALPFSLEQLTQLRVLNLAGNKLTELPPFLGQLTQLRDLSLESNELTELPSFLGELTQLQELDLSFNQLTALPEFLAQLTELRTLYLAGNELTELPSFLGQLTRLESLRLSGNQLTALPEFLGELTELRSLNVQGNQLTTLPRSLEKLAQLQDLYLDRNPLELELVAPYQEGTGAVLAYLRTRSADEEITLHEAKLILVGEGEVGKTCLMDALAGAPWRKHDTTHGIEIRAIQAIDPDDGREITLNGWDFGGQPIYRPTHQLFFSAPAVYLVVWKPREGPQAGLVREWIRLVKYREPQAKVLVVATHGGPKQRQPDMDRQEIRDLFGEDTVLGFFHVDNRPDDNGERRGIEELKRAIARVAAGLLEVGRKVPKRWQQVREALVETGKAYLALQELFPLCRAHGMDHDEARLFVTLSHRLGHLIHYEHDPQLRDMVILKPDWLATAISFVLDDEATRAAHGLVRLSRLGALWDDASRLEKDRYPKVLHALFLRLMERFDLSYRIMDPGKGGAKEAQSSDVDSSKPAMGTALHAFAHRDPDTDPAILIAQLVPDTRPEEQLRAAWLPDPAEGDGQQVQICRIVDDRGQSARAEGLFYQLIVRLHRFSLGQKRFDDSVHWQRGLVLDDGYNGRALLKHKGNDVHITVRAAYPERFLAMLTSEVKYLVESFWEGLRCDVMVPCVAPCGKDAPGSGRFEVEKLIVFKRQGMDKFPCMVSGCSQAQDIDVLLRNAPAARPVASKTLLDEFADVQRALAIIYQKIDKGQAATVGALAELDANDQRLLSRIDDAYDGLLRALTDAARDGPRLFSLEPVERSGFNPKQWTTTKFRLMLWCEHSRLPLPLLYGDPEKGVHEIALTRDWFRKAAPFLKVLTGTLRLALPVFPNIGLHIDNAAYKAVGKQLDAGQRIIDASLAGGDKQAMLDWLGSDAPEPDKGARSPVAARGAMLRELRAMLREQDPGCNFGGLVRVRNKRNEFLWVHPRFEGEY